MKIARVQATPLNLTVSVTGAGQTRTTSLSVCLVDAETNTDVELYIDANCSPDWASSRIANGGRYLPGAPARAGRARPEPRTIAEDGCWIGWLCMPIRRNA